MGEVKRGQVRHTRTRTTERTLANFICDNLSIPSTSQHTYEQRAMADTATASGLDGPEGETPIQRQARLRREKRQKKMAEQGEDRLAKIKALNGGVAPPDEVLGGRE